MPFEKGHKLAKGRPKGSQNEFTKQMKTVKETVLNVFNELQDDPKTELKQFAKEFPREFHAIAAKLIPTEVKAQVEVSGVKSIIIEPASKAKS
jgi:hypothetical protein